MDCPYCGTYNPEDRQTCWRCGKELPPKKPKKKKDPQKSAQRWLYALVILFVVINILRTCGVKLPFLSSPQPATDSSGYRLSRPSVAYQVEMPWSL